MRLFRKPLSLAERIGLVVAITAAAIVAVMAVVIVPKIRLADKYNAPSADKQALRDQALALIANTFKVDTSISDQCLFEIRLAHVPPSNLSTVPAVAGCKPISVFWFYEPAFGIDVENAYMATVDEDKVPTSNSVSVGGKSAAFEVRSESTGIAELPDVSAASDQGQLTSLAGFRCVESDRGLPTAKGTIVCKFSFLAGPNKGRSFYVVSPLAAGGYSAKQPRAQTP